jgi:hypothetical protein
MQVPQRIGAGAATGVRFSGDAWPPLMIEVAHPGPGAPHSLNR